jgi:hypothetical protein
VTEDVRDRNLPGGSLLSAYLDRQLMMWSDRGGASGHIGDRWAAHCSSWLDQTLEQIWTLGNDESMIVTDILRLDDIDAVSREANQNQLENPDFLLFGRTESGREMATITAVDAKFAADRIKHSQVSAQIVDNLLSIPASGVTMSLVQEILDARGYTSFSIVDGAFLCPDSTLTDFLLTRRSRGKSGAARIPGIVRIAPDPGTMFSSVPASQLIGTLARQDRLPVTPRENLLSLLYYFRVASACVYLWQEQHQPLFTIKPPEPAEIGVVGADIAGRATSGKSAYRIMLDLVDEAETVQRARQAIANVASLPLRMVEIRALLQANGYENEKQALRILRRDLELEFRSQLFASVGEIQASDPRPLPEILDQMAAMARDLREHMRDYATHHVKRLSIPSTSSPKS